MIHILEVRTPLMNRHHRMVCTAIGRRVNSLHKAERKRGRRFADSGRQTGQNTLHTAKGKKTNRLHTAKDRTACTQQKANRTNSLHTAKGSRAACTQQRAAERLAHSKGQQNGLHTAKGEQGRQPAHSNGGRENTLHKANAAKGLLQSQKIKAWSWSFTAFCSWATGGAGAVGRGETHSFSTQHQWDVCSERSRSKYMEFLTRGRCVASCRCTHASRSTL
eukprot:1147695-Pelagomonas_calceolata.AAC.5